MNRKLYVSNLSFAMRDDGLQDVFSQVGTVVSARVIMDRTGRSKGFGFVEMSSEAEATTAIEKFNGKEIAGRIIRVAEAQPEKPRTPGGDGSFQSRRPRFDGNSQGRFSRN